MFYHYNEKTRFYHFIKIFLVQKESDKSSLGTKKYTKTAILDDPKYWANQISSKGSSQSPSEYATSKLKKLPNVQRQIYPDEVPPWFPKKQSSKRRRKITIDPAYTTGCTEKGTK